MMRKYVVVLMLLICTQAKAQLADYIFQPGIHSVKLYKAGDIYSYPILTLNSGDLLELHFDDLDADVKNFYYSFQLCNADWTASSLQSFDYTRGFQTTRITNYRNSSISTIRYTHYQATVPDRSSAPTRSGNYLLKVFRNNDTSDLFFTKRFLVVDNKVSIGAQIRQPFSSQLFRSDQRVQISVNTANARINTLSPQDLKVVVLQNNSWTTAAMVDRPTIYRGNYYEYSDDNTSFPAGREWRWLDLRSLRLMSDRMQDLVDTSDNRVDVYVKPDTERKSLIYVYYNDLNGIYTIENIDGNNPHWQSDYAWVHFSFIPPNNQPYAGRDIFIYGELTNYRADQDSRMDFNSEKGIYQKSLFLKQGYYNYSYITAGAGEGRNRFSLENTEGNFNNTENIYTVLVYFRPFGSRADELIGYTQVSSLTGR